MNITDGVLGQLERQFYSTEIKISYTASQRFCFASVISLNDSNDLRVIDAQSLKCRPWLFKERITSLFT